MKSKIKKLKKSKNWKKMNKFKEELKNYDLSQYKNIFSPKIWKLLNSQVIDENLKKDIKELAKACQNYLKKNDTNI